VDETADQIRLEGGRGVAVRCDHTSDDDVRALFARINTEQGRLDLLVNNVWGGYEHHEGARFQLPFWEQPVRHWEGMFVAGVRAHLTTSQQAVPLMLPARRGLIISTTAWDHDKYLGNLFYDVAKAALHRMVHGMAHELRAHGITALALAPGFVRTERVMSALGAANPERVKASGFDLDSTESPAYVGRAVVALAGDRDVGSYAGQVVQVGALARHYGFTDVDGRQVPPFVIPG
jgi:NAD(P)-dependent dehydrogenase (short-subunit alcohol dehydrogenase family)